MHNIPISKNTNKVIDKIINNNNIPNTILFYNDYKNIGLSIAINFIKNLIKNKENIYNNPDISFVVPMTVAEKDYKENIRMFLENIRKNIHFSEEDWANELNANNKKTIIGVKQIEKIFQNLSRKSFYGGNRFVLVWRPEKMEQRTSNHLLKVLEEPPEKTTFLFVSKDHTKMLPTILSRTFKVKIDTLEKEKYIDFIIKKLSIQKEQATSIFHLFNGDYNKIQKSINQLENIQKHTEMFQKWMRLCYKRDIEEINFFVDEISKKEKHQQISFITFCVNSIRKTFAVNNSIDNIVFLDKQEEAFIKNFAPFIKQRYIDVVKILEEVVEGIQGNLNTKMIFYNSTTKLVKTIKK